MRIAQISPLFEAVPPKLYGGTERVVYSLTEELVAMGHDVTLFASGDSITSAKLAPMRDQALRLDPTVIDWIAIYMRMMEQTTATQGGSTFHEPVFSVVNAALDVAVMRLASAPGSRSAK